MLKQKGLTHVDVPGGWEHLQCGNLPSIASQHGVLNLAYVHALG